MTGIVNGLHPAPFLSLSLSSLMDSKILKLAHRQLADYDNHRPGINGSGILTLSEAYDLQIEVARLRTQRGETLAGYKVGCTSEAIRSQLGLDEPVWAHLFAGEMHKTGAVLDAYKFECLAVEGEFAFRIGEDIPGSAWLLKNRTRAVAGFFPVIELHNYVFRVPTSYDTRTGRQQRSERWCRPTRSGNSGAKTW